MASEFLATIPDTVRGLFRHDPSTRAASVQFWVVASVVLLLLKFAVGAIGPRFMVSSHDVKLGVQIIMILSYYTVSYSLGLMQPSSAERGSVTNDLFQVWAVLIVTMQDSASMGRPYQPRQLSTVDLLNSLWSANLLRAKTPAYLKAPLWIIWSIHALRVVWFYFSSDRASGACIDNMKLVSDYMASKQQAAANDAGAAIPEAETMLGYDYVVLGEERQVKIIQRPSFTFLLDETHKEKLITVARVWGCSNNDQDKLLGRGADGDNRFKDVCLSFALYKLLRRRFFDFPIPEANDPATRKLVAHLILEKPDNRGYERVFRVTEVELSLLQDLSYSKHPVVFANGFPTLRLILSLFMTGAASYLAYAVRGLPTATIAVTKGGHLARITHGGFVTRVIILIMVWRELWEMGVYVLSQWTKVVIICHYIRLPQSPTTGWIPRLRRFVTQKVAKIMFCLVRRGRWHQNIQQHNLLMPAQAKTTRNRRLRSRSVKLGINVQRVIFESLNEVLSAASAEDAKKEPSPALAQKRRNKLLMSQHRKALGNNRQLQSKISDIYHALNSGNTHKILVWHVATSICQIKLLLKKSSRSVRVDLYTLCPMESLPEHYTTAVNLSNYCAYLVTKALVPDNGLVANKVFEAVSKEAAYALSKCGTLGEVDDALVVKIDKQKDQSIVKIGTELSMELMSTYPVDKDLWERLGRFWAGYLLQLSANTRAAKHQVHLQGQGELTTHLWALLSHAGFLGDTSHGHQMLDTDDLNA